MPGTPYQLTPLQARKQLLLVESELNRAQLHEELQRLNRHFHDLKNQCQSMVSRAAAIVTLVKSVQAQWAGSQKTGGRPWWRRLGGWLRTGASLWQLFDSRSQ